MKFGIVTYIGPLQGIVRKITIFLKIQHGGGAMLKITCILCKECSRYLPFLILGSVFSDCVVFYGDIYYLNSKCVCVYCLNRKKPAWQEKDIATSFGTLIVFIVVFLLLQFCTYRQLLELKLLALPFCPAHCIFYCSFLHTVQINDDDEIRHSELSSNDNNKRDHSNGSE